MLVKWVILGRKNPNFHFPGTVLIDTPKKNHEAMRAAGAHR